MAATQTRTKPGILARVFTWFLPWFFNQLYHQFSWIYDLVACLVSLGQWQTWVKSVIPFIRSSLVLELGHGPGHLQAALLAQGIQCIGLDLSKQMGRQAYRRLRRLHLQPRLINARSQDMPLAGGAFPQIVVTFPSEYIVAPNTLSEIYRILSPGGSAAVLLFAWITGQNVIEKGAAWLFRVTGESPIWNDSFLAPARAVGFLARSEIILLPKSKLLVLHLDKPLESSINSLH